VTAEREGPDEVVQADTDGEEIEERLEEAGDEEDPLAAVDEDIALEDPPGPLPALEEGGG
jgi:hypothetical protein